jgi:hypothetical protein
MNIRRNRTYYFRKSGNQVKTIEPTNYGGRGNWVVERTDGASAGKQMVVPGRALVTTLD